MMIRKMLGSNAVRADGFVCVTLLAVAWISSTHFGQPTNVLEVRRSLPEALVLVMLLWSYWRCIVTPPGTVPASWAERAAEQAALTPEIRRRWCPHCSQWKPSRAHHCSVCKVCVLKYDHHCPWIANCVGYYNHKQFMLLTTSAAVLCWMVCVKSWRPFRRCVGSEEQLTLAQAAEAALADAPAGGCGNFGAMFVSVSCLAVLVTAFCVQHHLLVLCNRTTLESMDNDPINPHNHGLWHNLVEVYGPKWWLWLVPVAARPVSETDGADFAEPQEYVKVRKLRRLDSSAFRSGDRTDDDLGDELQEQLTKLLEVPAPRSTSEVSPASPGKVPGVASLQRPPPHHAREGRVL